MPEVKESHLLYYRLCFSCCFTLALLLFIEVGSAIVLRVKGYPRSKFPMANESSVYMSEPWAKQFWKENYEAGKFSYEPYVVWKQLPYAGQTLNIDPDLRRRIVNSQCDGKTYTIWMFGGSTMWGAGSPDWETIPSHLAELFSKADEPACVRNFAQTGWNNTQEVIELMLELKRTPNRPNLVIFYDGYNDGYTFYQSGKIDAHLNYDRIRELMERPSRQRRLGFVIDFLLSTHTARLLTGAPSPRSLLEGFSVPLPPPPNEAGAKKDLEIAYLGNLDVVKALA
ncbi:MAG: SGNH/GDSL hydrolase family protein, partial [Candidatus Acidiferrales bacterium]